MVLVKISVPPAPATFPGPESQPRPTNPFLQIHMGLHPNNNTASSWNDLSPSTNLHPHYPVTPNSSPHSSCPDTNSKPLEHHLNSALAILIQTSGILADASDVTPQARNTLKAINALVSMETPRRPRFKSVRKLAKWLQIPRSPK